MNIHEYQAKQLLARYEVPIPPGEAVGTPDEARAVAKRLLAEGHPRVVVKAQIHAGGRGKGTFRNGLAGGVQVCASADEVLERAQAMLGHVLVTRQTGPEGRWVSRLLIEAGVRILKEFYAAVLLDRAAGCPVFMVSTEGGMDIEEVAAQTPERIVREPVDPLLGLRPFQARKLAVALGWHQDVLRAGEKLLQGVYRTWWESDASLVELNPLGLIEGPAGKPVLVALDGKVGLDDNALFRHPELQALRDRAEEAPLEVEASQHGLNYIKLEGNIACLVNGAGLAMATMDLIQHCGGQPANFLDVGGGASVEQVTAAFQIIMKDPHVQAILVNIFGGIMDCDVIATGIVQAVQQTGLRLPLVVRLEGNNVQAGKLTLRNSGLPILSGDSMAEAARTVVRAAAAATQPAP